MIFNFEYNNIKNLIYYQYPIPNPQSPSPSPHLPNPETKHIKNYSYKY